MTYSYVLQVYLYLGFTAHLMASLGSITGTLVPPILSDHFGFDITFVSYYTLGIYTSSFLGGIVL